MNHDLIRAEVSSIRSMGEALSWARRQTPLAAFVNAVAQDEYTHDVIVRVAPDAFVVFDTT